MPVVLQVVTGTALQPARIQLVRRTVHLLARMDVQTTVEVQDVQANVIHPALQAVIRTAKVVSPLPPNAPPDAGRTVKEVADQDAITRVAEVAAADVPETATATALAPAVLHASAHVKHIA